MKYFLVFLSTFLCATGVYAQTFSLDADIRPRSEYRHGYGNLFPNEAKPAAFVVQRSRLNLGYTAEKLEIMISLQDVRTWGDTRQLLAGDPNNSFSLFQAWAELKLSNNWATKLGRQVISYDDQRIFGEVDWTMQGRFHDALLLKYQKDGFRMDIGAAFSQENPRLTGSVYNINGFFSYKTMQYAYLHKQWNQSNISLLFLNNGFQKFSDPANVVADGVYNRQTTGTYFQFPLGNIKFSGSAYYQFGKASEDIDLSAYELSLQGDYKIKNTLLGLGAELLSGTDQAGSDKNHSFFPLYGTNHKFNGFMDYFYVGSHANNVGLTDLFGKVLLKTGDSSSLLLKAHYFSSNADLLNNADKYLGTEIDLVYGRPLLKNVKLNLGYSHMFASEGMSLIKNNITSKNTNNWAWAQVIINPKLFEINFE
ncbi:alginate export family protein [Gramella sp. AN32]|uniref:Alginate export family protein n=1 Tax=Christiangramia antarctica TaxID=2058158 RepID=A0ABW5X8Z0_9FLAO|nr:alginate export family protein [Gramella sp. AN32]MCM4155964.1 hypothetical protein [Gramella sp. AN32]